MCRRFRSKARSRGARIRQNTLLCWETSRSSRSSLRRSRDPGCVTALSFCPTSPIKLLSMPRHGSEFVANTLGEASQLFEQRLEQSPALRDWWLQQQKGSGRKLEDVLNQVRTFNSYLGDEIVFAVGQERNDLHRFARRAAAKIRQPGLETFSGGSKPTGGGGTEPKSQPQLQSIAACASNRS